MLVKEELDNLFKMEELKVYLKLVQRNAIEGNTLTLKETQVVLEGITIRSN